MRILHTPLLKDRILARVRVVVAMVVAILMGLSGMAAAQEQPAAAAATINNPPPLTIEAYKKELLPINFPKALGRDSLSGADKQVISQAIHYHVAELIDPKFQVQWGRLRGKLVTLIENAKEAPKQLALEQATMRAGMLLNEPNISSQVQGALLLSDLNLVARRSDGTPAIPFAGASTELLRALTSPAISLAAKIDAVQGLSRILLLADPPLALRVEISERLANGIREIRAARGTPQALDDTGYRFYLWNLVGALGNCNRVYNQTRQPVFADVLMEVLTDGREDWLARAKAAQALSRLPYESAARADLLVLNYAVAQFTRDMALAYNANVKTGQAWPLWRRVAIHIYFAYNAEVPKERDLAIGLLYQVKRPGLAVAEPKVKEANKLVLDVTNVLTKTPVGVPGQEPRVPQQMIDGLANWLQANTPANLKLTPESPDIPVPPAPAKTADSK